MRLLDKEAEQLAPTDNAFASAEAVRHPMVKYFLLMSLATKNAYQILQPVTNRVIHRCG